MTKRANYVIVEETADHVLIRDVGPWDQYLSVTNGAEQVVEELAAKVGNRRLECLDTNGDRDQLLIVKGKFAGFSPCQGADLQQ